jgi:hypothetical protein
MDEQEWLTCRYPSSMLTQRRGWHRSHRKLRLLAAAVCRRIWSLLPPKCRLAVEVVERRAEGQATKEELQNACPMYVQRAGPAHNSVVFAAAPSPYYRSWMSQTLSHAAWAIAKDGPKFDAERRAQCDLIRDIFGNPFRPATVDRAWLSWNDGTLPKLAQAIYEERTLPAGHLDTTRLAVLADALEEAGCDDADILAHCRGPGPHVRGCWVIDLLLATK